MRRLFIDEENAGDDRKRREHRRLNALVGYCEAAGCRREILLSYFGESSRPCGNCDNCRKPVELVEGTLLAQQILAAVRQSGERYGAAHIVDVLRGSATERVVAARHDRLAAFGVGATRKKDEWHSLVRQLVSGGWLDIDIAGFGGLSVSGKGHALLRGAESFHYRTFEKSPRVRANARNADAGAVDDTLLASLKSLRLRLAKEKRLPAYLVFSDRTLLDMAGRRPRNTEEFAQVSGVGAAKLHEFGEAFLAVLAAHSPIERV
jgi:ATP-dependent DNA helicase RecQ